MPITVRQFVDRLTDSKVMSRDEIAAFKDSLQVQPEDGEQFAKLLIKQKKLTQFQAQRIYQGKYKGLILGNYLILDTLGAGGMGQVFLAKHRHMGRMVALKTLPEAVAKDDDTIRRFRREVIAAAKLSHPNIVTAFDADQANGIHYFVMEHVKGKDLSRLVKETGKLSVEQALDFVLQAAQGLQYAHEEGIVHRDIKPANLLVNSKGVVQILDLGLARIDSEADDQTASALTTTGTLMGTMDYMSPEQAMDTHTADARSDIYSLGCVLHFLLTGMPVYGGDTVVKKIMAHQQQAIPSLRESRSDVPEAVDAVFQKMLAKTPEERYQTMTEAIAALECCTVGATAATVAGSTPKLAADSNMLTFLEGLEQAEMPTILTKPDQQEDSSKIETVPSGVLHETLVGGIGERKKKGDGPSRNDTNPLLIGGGLLGLLLLFGIIVITIRNEDGTETKTTIEVPDGATVEVKQDGQVVAAVPPASEPVSAPPVLEGLQNHALSFDGESDYVYGLGAQMDFAKPFTLEAKASIAGQPVTQDGSRNILGNQRLGIRLQYGHENWDSMLTGTHLYAPIYPGLHPNHTEWAQLALQSDGSELTLFVDGKRIASEQVTPQSGLSRPGMGADFTAQKAGVPTAADNFFHGVIDEVRISNIARYTESYTPSDRLEADEHTLALYHFDEGSGDVLKDSSGNGHHGTIVGAKWVRVDDDLRVIEPTRDPKENWAIRFEGKAADLVFPLQVDSTKPLTLEADVQVLNTDFDTSKFLVTAGTLRLGIFVPTNQRQAAFGAAYYGSNGGVNALAPLGDVDSKPHRLAVSSDGTMIRFFLDGVLIDEASIESPASGSNRVRVGSNLRDAEVFDGIVDEFRVSSIARYTESYTPSDRLEADEHTLALYHFDEGGGDVLQDSSGNGHHGKIIGAKWVRLDEE